MAAFSYNEFMSSGHRMLSILQEDATILLDGETIPTCGHAVIVSIMVCNKSEVEKMINLSVKKIDDTEDTVICTKVPVPVGEPFDLLKGSKIFLNKHDILKAWTDSEGQEWLNVYVSYTFYTPSDLLTEV